MEQFAWPIQKKPEQENVKGCENIKVKFNKPKNCMNETKTSKWYPGRIKENKKAFFFY